MWGDGLLATLPSRARARFRVGRFLDVDGSAAVFALPNETHRSYCEEVRPEVEAALGVHFGAAVPIRLVVDEESDVEAASATPPGHISCSGAVGGRGAAGAGTDGGGRPRRAAPPGGADTDEEPDLLDPAVLAAETDLAGPAPTPEERLKQAFPGAEEV